MKLAMIIKYFSSIGISPSGGMVDAADSKSAAFTGVRVRVSPRAPRFSFIIFDYVVLNLKVKRR